MIELDDSADWPRRCNSPASLLALRCTTTTPPPAPSGFVTRQGKNLILDGKVWKFVGVNAFGLTAAAPASRTRSRRWTDYAFVHGGPNIDLGSLHEYDYEFQNGKTIVSPHFNPTIAAMNAINKPLYIGEVGIRLSNACMTGQQRADVVVQANAYFARGSVGMLYWTWVSNPPAESCAQPIPYEIGTSSPIVTAIRNYLIP